VNTLLITSSRAAKCTVSRKPVGPSALFTASPIFGTAIEAAQPIVQNRNQLVGVYAVNTPMAATSFDLMVMQTVSRKNNLPRRFLRENAGAKTQTPCLKPKGRQQRQTNE